MSRKHIIYYTKAIFAWCQSHPNIHILAPRITKKAAKQLSWCQDAKISAKLVPRWPSWCQDTSSSWCQDAKIAAKLVPRYQDSFVREAIWSINHDFQPLPRHPKIDHFGTRIATCKYVTKTYYLIHKNYICMVPKPLKYRYFDTQNHQESS